MEEADARPNPATLINFGTEAGSGGHLSSVWMESTTERGTIYVPESYLSTGTLTPGMKTIVTTSFLSFLSCCAFGQDKAAISVAEAGCGPDNFELSVTTDESRHPTPSPENGKAKIYVVQRATGTFKFGADGKWLGALKGGTYFHATVEPGEHHLCVKGQLPLWKGLSLHQLNAKPGETYYFFVHVVTGGGSDELTLTQLDPDEGMELVAKSRFISSQAK